MKLRNLVLGMMTCAALAACSNEDLVDNNGGNQFNGEDAYVAVSISNPSIFNRAVEGEDVGTVEENTVNSATFVFFDAAGNYLTHVAITGAELKLSKDQQKSEAVLVLKNTTLEPTHVLAFVNPPKGLNMAQSLTKLSEAADAYGYANDGTYAMTNSVFTKNDAKHGAVALAGHIFDSADKAIAAGAPVTIYVERVVSKVTVNNNIRVNSTDTELGLLKPQIVGWKLSGINEASYAIKKTDDAITASWAWGTNRSYWAQDMNYSDNTGLVYLPYKDVTAKTATEYCYENTFTVNALGGTVPYTHLLVTAQIVDEQNFPISTFCLYNGAYYTEAGLKSVFVAGLEGFKYNGNAITASDIVFVKANGTSTESYFAKATFVDPSKTSAEAIAALAAKGNFPMYKDGKSYFWANIKHLGGSGETGEYGVVRNHAYTLNLKSITGLGTPVIDPDQPIIPEIPSDNNSYLAATVEILSWKVVPAQSVDLGK